MATYRQLSDQVLRRLAGGDVPDDFPIEQEDIWMAITQLISFLTKKDLYEAIQLGERTNIDGMFYATVAGVEIHRDSTRYPYAYLPAKPNIIHGRGKPQVFHNGEITADFVYTEAGQFAVLQKSSVADYSNNIHFWIETVTDEAACTTTTKIFFEDNLSDCVEKVNIRLVPSTDLRCISPDAQIPLSPHLEHELVEMLIKAFAPMEVKQEDVRADSIKN